MLNSSGSSITSYNFCMFALSNSFIRPLYIHIHSNNVLLFTFSSAHSLPMEWDNAMVFPHEVRFNVDIKKKKQQDKDLNNNNRGRWDVQKSELKMEKNGIEWNNTYFYPIIILIFSHFLTFRRFLLSWCVASYFEWILFQYFIMISFSFVLLFMIMFFYLWIYLSYIHGLLLS